MFLDYMEKNNNKECLPNFIIWKLFFSCKI